MGASREKREETLWDNLQHEEIVPIEFTEEINPINFGLEVTKAQQMISGLSNVFAEREVLKEAYADVIGLEITTENLPTFKELRLKIVKNRTQGIEKWHKTNKAFYLAGGRFVDAIKNKEVLENEQMEYKLLEAEKYFENLEKGRLNNLRLEREDLLRPFVEILPNDLSSLEQDVFDSFLETKKKAFADKIEADRIEAERIEKERVEKEKAFESQRLENERLKKEAEAKELQLKAEREKAESERKAIEDKARELAKIEADKQTKIQALKDAEIKKEREAKEKLEAEIKAKKDAEHKAELLKQSERLKAEAEAEKLAKAPIKKQLSTWVNSFELPTTNVDNEVSKEVKEKFEAFKKWANNQVNNL